MRPPQLPPPHHGLEGWDWILLISQEVSLGHEWLSANKFNLFSPTIRKSFICHSRTFLSLTHSCWLKLGLERKQAGEKSTECWVERKEAWWIWFYITFAKGSLSAQCLSVQTSHVELTGLTHVYSLYKAESLHSNVANMPPEMGSSHSWLHRTDEEFAFCVYKKNSKSTFTMGRIKEQRTFQKCCAYVKDWASIWRAFQGSWC